MEERATFPIRKCGQLAAMPLDDDSANEKPQSRALWLRCHERAEDLVQSLWGYPRPGILHPHNNPVTTLTLGYQAQHAASTRCVAHGLDRVVSKIKDDLLELSSVAPEWGAFRTRALIQW